LGKLTALPGADELTLETERLLMRPATIADLGPLHEVWGDRDVMRWIGPGDAYSRDVEESESRLQKILAHQEEHGFSLWVVLERGSGTVLGDCGLVLFGYEGPEIELACRLRKGAWGHGYATEAGRAWLDHGFGPLDLKRIVAASHPGNEASQRVLEKLGMRCEGETELDGTRVLLYAIEQRDRER
jgi:[ribosomal protein S5]-alanine N-acetyltransferase